MSLDITPGDGIVGELELLGDLIVGGFPEAVFTLPGVSVDEVLDHARLYLGFSEAAQAAHARVRGLEVPEFVGVEGEFFRGRVPGELAMQLGAAVESYSRVGSGIKELARELDASQAALKPLEARARAVFEHMQKVWIKVNVPFTEYSGLRSEWDELVRAAGVVHERVAVAGQQAAAAINAGTEAMVPVNDYFSTLPGGAVAGGVVAQGVRSTASRAVSAAGGVTGAPGRAAKATADGLGAVAGAVTSVPQQVSARGQQLAAQVTPDGIKVGGQLLTDPTSEQAQKLVRDGQATNILGLDPTGVPTAMMMLASPNTLLREQSRKKSAGRRWSGEGAKAQSIAESAVGQVVSVPGRFVGGAVDRFGNTIAGNAALIGVGGDPVRAWTGLLSNVTSPVAGAGRAVASATPEQILADPVAAAGSAATHAPAAVPFVGWAYGLVEWATKPGELAREGAKEILTSALDTLTLKNLEAGQAVANTGEVQVTTSDVDIHADNGGYVTFTLPDLEGGEPKAWYILATPDSPGNFTTDVPTAPGEELIERADGSVVLVNSGTGQIVRTIKTPWAKDALGRDQPTWYSIDKVDDQTSTITQHIAPNKGALYPLVADAPGGAGAGAGAGAAVGSSSTTPNADAELARIQAAVAAQNAPKPPAPVQPRPVVADVQIPAAVAPAIAPIAQAQGAAVSESGSADTASATVVQTSDTGTQTSTRIETRGGLGGVPRNTDVVTTVSDGSGEAVSVERTHTVGEAETTRPTVTGGLTPGQAREAQVLMPAITSLLQVSPTDGAVAVAAPLLPNPAAVPAGTVPILPVDSRPLPPARTAPTRDTAPGGVTPERAGALLGGPMGPILRGLLSISAVDGTVTARGTEELPADPGAVQALARGGAGFLIPGTRISPSGRLVVPGDDGSIRNTDPRTGVTEVLSADMVQTTTIPQAGGETLTIATLPDGRNLSTTTDRYGKTAMVLAGTASGGPQHGYVVRDDGSRVPLTSIGQSLYTTDSEGRLTRAGDLQAMRIAPRDIPTSQAVAEQTINFGAGLGRGTADAVTGIGAIIRDPSILAPLVGLDDKVSAGDAWKQVGKAMIAWDDYARGDTAYASGKVVANVITAIVGSKGTSTLGKVGKVAAVDAIDRTVARSVAGSAWRPVYEGIRLDRATQQLSKQLLAEGAKAAGKNAPAALPAAAAGTTAAPAAERVLPGAATKIGGTTPAVDAAAAVTKTPPTPGTSAGRVSAGDAAASIDRASAPTTAGATAASTATGSGSGVAGATPTAGGLAEQVMVRGFGPRGVTETSSIGRTWANDIPTSAPKAAAAEEIAKLAADGKPRAFNADGTIPANSLFKLTDPRTWEPMRFFSKETWNSIDPAWQPARAGDRFENVLRQFYKDRGFQNQVYLRKGDGHVILDEYLPDSIIGSVKLTQAADNPGYFISAINEFKTKYAAGAQVKPVPTSTTRGLDGIIDGRNVLIIPPQSSVIPSNLLKYASERNVYVVDVIGTVHNASGGLPPLPKHVVDSIKIT